MVAQRPHVRSGDGYTLVEVAVVLVVLSALLVLAVPSYLGFDARAAKRTAAADVRAAVSVAEAYHADNETYTGMTVAVLRGYDRGLAVDHVGVSPDGRTFCVDRTADAHSAFVIRGAAPHTPPAPGADAGEVDDTGQCPATIDDASN
jgi:prepilin-type N-terminal cleavage/methylation domain-containing protein